MLEKGGDVKTLLFPKFEKLSEIFESVRDYESGVGRETQKGSYTFSWYCRRRCRDQSLKSYHAKPRAEVIEEIVKSLAVDGRFTFEIVDHDDGLSLVIVSYDQIIGSRWLARVKTTSVRKFGPHEHLC